MDLHRRPTLLLTAEAWQKMLTYVNLATGEINGWAYLNRVDDSTLRLESPDDVFITDQVVTAGSADVSSDTSGMAMHRAVYVDDRPDELKLQWHSHVKDAAIFSRTDTGTMDAYGYAGATWMASLVLNQFGQVSCRYDTYTPMRASTDVEVYLELPVSQNLMTGCVDDMLEHVTVKHSVQVAKGRGKEGEDARYKSYERALTRDQLQMPHPYDATLIPLSRLN